MKLLRLIKDTVSTSGTMITIKKLVVVKPFLIYGENPVGRTTPRKIINYKKEY